MKLATYNNGSRDGQLLVVSRDLNRATKALDIAPTFQEALDNWDVVKPKLEILYAQLNNHEVDFFPFIPKHMAAPLPRAYQWADGSAYLNHVELVRKARGVEMPANFLVDPLMYQGGSDNFLGPHQEVAIENEAWGIDFEAEVAVIVNDVKMGTTAEMAGEHICLLMLVNDVSLRNLIFDEIAKGFGFFQSKPASSFSPVAITPDELGDDWQDYKINLPLVTHYNDKWFGAPNAGVDMNFNFATLVAHAAKTRHLCAGTIIGSGTVSNRDPSVGSSCIAEVRVLEKLKEGEAKTPFMKFGDRVRIDMFDRHNKSIFGAIDQQIVAYEPSEF